MVFVCRFTMATNPLLVCVGSKSEACKASTIGCDVRFLRLRFGFEHVRKQIIFAGFIRDELCEIDLLCMRSLSLFLLNKPQKLFVC